MKEVLLLLLIAADYVVLVYFGALNLLHTAFLVISFVVINSHVKRTAYSPMKDLVISPETPPISILIPVYNERNKVIQAANSALSVNYPFYDVIVINDGSTDETLHALIRRFNLRKMDLVYRYTIKTAPVKGFYYNRAIPHLLVIDKERGGTADALNCGINACRSPYFCSVNPKWVLERDALLNLISPVIESAVPVVACSGDVRVLNGTTLRDSVIQEISLPRSSLALFQVVEYLRSFLFARVGLNALRVTPLLSGAFTLYRKSAVLDAGGYPSKDTAEDLALMVRLHTYHQETKRPYSVKFVPDLLCWTEVTESLKTLGVQRRRSHLGLLQIISEHRRLLFDRRYGNLAMFSLPYLFLVEIVTPVIEIVGYATVISSYLLGCITLKFLLMFLFLVVFYGMFLSVAAICLEESTYQLYPRLSHLLWLVLYAALENFAYRQINALWKCQALLAYLTRRIFKALPKLRPRTA